MHRNVGVGELWKKWEKWSVGEGNFQFGKTFKYYFQCRRADIVLGQRQSAGGAGQADKAGEI